ncbi:hypothetical protein [Hydrogenibacillus schlegelii]|uniref:hypothetical protein n=1 Tax=Hydrogenibacillus schlegelii TaxID=1484 RepID=UPI0012E352AC|nr:hypothetical protein [Hydrogenibacillus schlegelii]
MLFRSLVARALLAGAAFGLFYDGAGALFRRMRSAPVRALMEALAWAAGRSSSLPPSP